MITEVLADSGEDVNTPLHVLFLGSVEGAVIGKEKFVDGGCGYTRLEVHPPLIEEVAVRPVGQADPGAFAALSGDEDRVLGPTMTAEAALAFRQETLFQMVVQAVEKDANEDFPGENP
ncbi:hypothetical protein SprV_0100253300 [Sparganum proliferum]